MSFLLFSVAVPAYDATVSAPEAKTPSSLAKIGDSLNVREASAHRGSKKHNQRHRARQLALAASDAPAPGAEVILSDTFDRETDEFEPPWSEVDRAAPDRLTTDSAVKRKGTHSAKFTVRDSDLLGYSSPRAQLNWLEKFCEGDKRYIGWSTMLPSGAWINIMQVGFGPPWGYPPLIFSYYGSKISVRNDSGGDGHRTQVASFTPTRGAWQDVVMRVKFSKSSSIGYVEMWVNGKQLSMANGQTRQYMNTLRPDATGCGSLMPTFYRSEGSWEWLTLYHDEVKVGNTYADVAP